MSVQVLGEQFDVNGHDKTMEGFRGSHATNSKGLLNHMEGKKLEAPRAPYDPSHPDNRWPILLHHPSKPPLEVGRSLKGMDSAMHKRVEAENQLAVKALEAQGYRAQPFAKLQMVVEDPAVEKANLLRQNLELQGHITTMLERMAKLEANQAPSAAPFPTK